MWVVGGSAKPADTVTYMTGLIVWYATLWSIKTDVRDYFAQCGDSSFVTLQAPGAAVVLLSVISMPGIE